MWHITSFYRFAIIEKDKLSEVVKEFNDTFSKSGLLGLTLFAQEGANSTAAAESVDLIQKFKDWFEALPGFSPIIWKDSKSEKAPFKRFVTDIRNEIVTLKRPDLFPNQNQNNHLSPAEWHAALTSNEDFVLIDTRNDYENKIGMFKGAIDPKIKHFSQFGEWLDKAQIPKEKKVLMYCTGGVRCEKAILEMQQRGYESVFQLEGGILKYLEEFPNQQFEGECYVFDHRVAVDQNLNTSSSYSLCPLCGDSATETISCNKCKKEARICPSCAKHPYSQACSKNCKYYLRNHGYGESQGIHSRR